MQPLSGSNHLSILHLPSGHPVILTSCLRCCRSEKDLVFAEAPALPPTDVVVDLEVQAWADMECRYGQELAEAATAAEEETADADDYRLADIIEATRLKNAEPLPFIHADGSVQWQGDGRAVAGRRRRPSPQGAASHVLLAWRSQLVRPLSVGAGPSLRHQQR